MTKLLYAIAMAVMAAGCGSNSAERATATGVSSDDGAGAPFVAVPRQALVGHRAPPVALDLLDGTRVELAQLIGQQPIYLKFWATWCEPCREQMPHTMATWRTHRDRLAVFAVDVGLSDPIENVRAFVAARQLELPVAIDRDGSVSEQFHVNVTPQHVVIDRSGVVRYVGHAITPELERAIASVVDAASPEPAVAAAAPAAPAPALTAEPPALALDDGTSLALATRPRGRLALTFVKLSCDTYIAKSQPATGAACAAHARQIEEQRRAHPDLPWVIVAHPVWTDAEDVGSFRKRLGATAPIGIDATSAWFRRFRVRDVYTTVLLDAAGAELGRVGGDGAGLAALVSRAP